MTDTLIRGVPDEVLVAIERAERHVAALAADLDDPAALSDVWS